MNGFVVYKDHDGWFHWTTVYRWDMPTFKLDGQRVDTRVEVGRYETLAEARDVRHAYNMMLHGKPTANDTFNRRLEKACGNTNNIPSVWPKH